MKTMLEIKNLSIEFRERKETEEVVKQVSFRLDKGEILGIVGESGSGKTMIALTLSGLLKEHAVIESGQILFQGVDILRYDKKQWRSLQGKNISMIFQEPMTALNPTLKIGKQVEESLILHTNLKSRDRKQKVFEMLRQVELSDPEIVYHRYPHELSGGMRQRVMIAAAVICHPKLLIADEPTTALDVGTQKQVLELLKKLNRSMGMSILFISHNLKVVTEICDRILVMREGRIIEQGIAAEIFQNPRDAYTKALIESIPPRTELHLEKAGSKDE